MSHCRASVAAGSGRACVASARSAASARETEPPEVPCMRASSGSQMGRTRGRSAYDPRTALVPFVGRAQEVGCLPSQLESPADDDIGLVLIAGEAGVGKSRLLAEAVDPEP